jgi:UDP-N-acetylmuramate--alanine ligase
MSRIYFIGIGGVGMSGLAGVMLARGFTVAGSDPHPNAATARLEERGATVYSTQAAANIERESPERVVYTAAIPEDNPELVAARGLGVPVITRAEFLGEMMAEFGGPRIAIGGTHGKTTTTAMTAEVLLAGGLDPTVLVGGEYPPIGGNVRVGGGEVFLTEACEAYNSFLAFRPDITVVTNVEADHLDHYGTEEGVFEGFRQFLSQTTPEGTVVINAADAGCVRLAELAGGSLPRRVIWYGAERPDGESLIAANAVTAHGRATFDLQHRIGGGVELLGTVELPVPGEHNVLNALAAAAAGLAAGVDGQAIAAGLARFQGTGRRFETLGEVNGVLVIDDYAHHPTEIRATLAAARAAYPERRLVAVFQPHLYSRTRDFMDEFGEALAAADAILLTNIYAAREQPIPGVNVADLAHKIAACAPRATLLYLPEKEDVAGALEWVTHEGDLVVVMGAGDIREAGEQFVRRATGAQEENAA